MEKSAHISTALHAIGAPLGVSFAHVTSQFNGRPYCLLRLGDWPSEITIFLEPAQAIQIMDAIRFGYQNEETETAEIPEMKQVAVRPNVPEMEGAGI